jgi:hypothetical protein
MHDGETQHIHREMPQLFGATRRELWDQIEEERRGTDHSVTATLEQLCLVGAPLLHTNTFRVYLPTCMVILKKIPTAAVVTGDDGSMMTMVLHRWYRHANPNGARWVPPPSPQQYYRHFPHRVLLGQLEEAKRVRREAWLSEVALQRLEVCIAPLQHCRQLYYRLLQALWCNPVITGAVEGLSHAPKITLVHRWARRSYLHRQREHMPQCHLPTGWWWERGPQCVAPDWHPQAAGDVADVAWTMLGAAVLPASRGVPIRCVPTMVVLPCRCCKTRRLEDRWLAGLAMLRWELCRQRGVCHHLFDRIMGWWCWLKKEAEFPRWATGGGPRDWWRGLMMIED